jgi:cellulose synthase/poly-beta-1,6-N-acetylglucosamine synthase-like glycosyltransferase
VDKVNGRKADATNAGISVARNPLVCVIDADSLIDVDAMLRATQPFLSDDGSVIAVGGSVRLTNGCDISGGRLNALGMPKEWIARFQILEYLRASWSPACPPRVGACCCSFPERSACSAATR